jgi:hypothetical protein
MKIAVKNARDWTNGDNWSRNDDVIYCLRVLEVLHWPATTEGMQSPVIAVAILLIFIGLFAFFAVLFRLT